MTIRGIIVATSLLSSLTAPSAISCSAQSPPHLVPLVELYTSEGCDSCPPADRWLSAVGTQNVVALALHVDYWDYIGWKDPFATPLFSQRQRAVAKWSGSRAVYTPQVLLSGRDYSWRAGKRALAERLQAIASRRASADIDLEWAPAAGIRAGELRVKASLSKLDRREQRALFVAVYENGLQSDVRAGENRGVRLHHDYVVRQWYGPSAFDATGRVQFRQSVVFGEDWNTSHAGVAAFVQDQQTGEVLQALSLPLCR